MPQLFEVPFLVAKPERNQDRLVRLLNRLSREPHCLGVMICAAEQLRRDEVALPVASTPCGSRDAGQALRHVPHETNAATCDAEGSFLLETPMLFDQRRLPFLERLERSDDDRPLGRNVVNDVRQFHRNVIRVASSRTV